MYIYIYTYICTYIYIYIYLGRFSKRDFVGFKIDQIQKPFVMCLEVLWMGLKCVMAHLDKHYATNIKTKQKRLSMIFFVFVYFFELRHTY